MYISMEPIKSERNRYGYKGVKRHHDCKKQFVAMVGNKLLGRYDTAYEAGQAYAFEVRNHTKTQQEFKFSENENKRKEESLKGLEQKFTSFLKNNENTSFQTSEVVDELLNLKPSERRRALKETKRLTFQGAAYSYGSFDNFFKKWSKQTSEIKAYKNKGACYYSWQETREEKALKVVKGEYGILSTPSSIKDLNSCFEVYFSEDDFGFRVSLEEKRITGIKIGTKASDTWKSSGAN